MKYTQHINNWENFNDVEQDQPGIVATTGGGLYTKNLMNCMCLILTNENGTYGMLHVSPGHKDTAKWVTSLRQQVGATAAIVTGGNLAAQSKERLDELASLLNGLTVVDETRSGWVPKELRAVRGSNSFTVGYAAVNTSTGEYALSMTPFAASVNPMAAATKARRNSADGGCTLM